VGQEICVDWIGEDWEVFGQLLEDGLLEEVHEDDDEEVDEVGLERGSEQGLGFDSSASAGVIISMGGRGRAREWEQLGVCRHAVL